jgi:2-oxoglutarate dehydrogenase E2 component (dihydrolipoamide succinyltransferase)
MRVDVIMPQMGESVAEGTVTKWIKKIGDKVERDEPLFEISTDKVDAEIPAPNAGYLVEILVGEGKTVEINTVVAVLSSEPLGAGAAPAKPAAPAAAASAAPAAPVAVPAAAAPAAPAAPVEKGDLDAEALRRLRSSPLVRKIAEANNVDISVLSGTGLSGRVTKKDILDHLEARTAAPAPAPAAAAPAPARVDDGGLKPVKAQISMDVPPRYLATPGPRDTVQAMSPMRKSIADHMGWSKRISAHVNSFLEIDMTRLVRLRERKKEEFLKKTGEKLTFMPFIMQAVVSALKAYPDCNASIVGEEIIYHRDVNLGIAVALDWGLIVPVVKNAEEKNLFGLTRSLNDLATRARNKKLSPDEVAGGTFTITNPGAFGSLTGTPIIPQPQVAILGVGAINKRPWVLESPEGDVIAVRHIMMMSLSYDHRLVDGATGARFLQHVQDFLENYDESRMG